MAYTPKVQLNNLVQKISSNPPLYKCIREGPKHHLRYKGVVTIDEESFESPHFYGNVKEAEHEAAKIALYYLSQRESLSHAFRNAREPSQGESSSQRELESHASGSVDKSGKYKNWLSEITQEIEVPLPLYTTIQSGPNNEAIFSSTVTVVGITFKGESARNKKQAERNAAMAAWLSLKGLGRNSSLDTVAESDEEDERTDIESDDEDEYTAVTRVLSEYDRKRKAPSSAAASYPPSPTHTNFPVQNSRPSTLAPSATLRSVRPRTDHRDRPMPGPSEIPALPRTYTMPTPLSTEVESHPSQIPLYGHNSGAWPQETTPYVPGYHYSTPCYRSTPRASISAIPAPSRATQMYLPPPPVTGTPLYATPPPVYATPPIYATPPPMYATPPQVYAAPSAWRGKPSVVFIPPPTGWYR